MFTPPKRSPGAGPEGLVATIPRAPAARPFWRACYEHGLDRPEHLPPGPLADAAIYLLVLVPVDLDVAVIVVIHVGAVLVTVVGRCVGVAGTRSGLTGISWCVGVTGIHRRGISRR